MIVVLDASVVLDLILNRQPQAAAIAKVLQQAEVLAAPQLLDVEVISVLRRLMEREELSQRRAEQAVTDYLDLPVQRYAQAPLLKRVLALEHPSLSGSDALYLVLAEVLEATLLTGNEVLSSRTDSRAKVQVIG